MNQIKCDFRSDTVTRPSEGMRQAMATAEVGDDVLGDDPTIHRLEALAAELTQKEAAIFVSSGTQSNLLAIMAHCQRGEEYIVGQMAHCYRWEAGGAAVLGSVQPQPIENESDGSIRLERIAAAIKPDDPHFAITRLLALENTWNGRVLPSEYVHQATDLARTQGLATHLDGARAFNASSAMDMDIAEVVAPFDSASLCLSKGLGAPVGSVLVGPHDVIGRARRLRKMLGGGMRQAGVLAAAGLYALAHNVERLKEDHALAMELADALQQFNGLSVHPPQTNMVFVDVEPSIAKSFASHLSANGVAVTMLRDGARQRWVTHLDVTREHVAMVASIVDQFFTQASALAEQ
ncbi:low-specificity L-threonine aldolase [Caballeronia hypogeia]|uniref:low-specificity L-threonine aldolase n=1 Tax=Caballeronia hypogeia TaxID=1777140 RepID=UPI004041F173